MEILYDKKTFFFFFINNSSIQSTVKITLYLNVYFSTTLFTCLRLVKNLNQKFSVKNFGELV